eukprot:ANDGO_00884.mRNA.1 N-acetylglucosaminylaminotransferase
MEEQPKRLLSTMRSIWRRNPFLSYSLIAVVLLVVVFALRSSRQLHVPGLEGDEVSDSSSSAHGQPKTRYNPQKPPLRKPVRSGDDDDVAGSDGGSETRRAETEVTGGMEDSDRQEPTGDVVSPVKKPKIPVKEKQNGQDSGVVQKGPKDLENAQFLIPNDQLGGFADSLAVHPSLIPIAILALSSSAELVGKTVAALEKSPFYNPEMIRIYTLHPDQKKDKKAQATADFAELFPEILTIQVQVTDSEQKPVSAKPANVLEAMVVRAAFRNAPAQFGDDSSSSSILFVEEGVELAPDALLFAAQCEKYLAPVGKNKDGVRNEKDLFGVSLVNGLQKGLHRARVLRSDSLDLRAVLIRKDSLPSLLDDWPKKNWRGYLRNAHVLYPEVSRTTDSIAENEYFEIPENQLSTAADADAFETMLKNLISWSPATAPAKGKSKGSKKSEPAPAAPSSQSTAPSTFKLVPYTATTKTDMIWKTIASVFRVNQASPPSNSYAGVSLFWAPDDRTYVVAVASYSPLVTKDSSKLKFMSADQVEGLKSDISGRSKEFLEAAAGQTGQSCTAVCAAKDLVCEPLFAPLINKCDEMKAMFKCRKDDCDGSMGPDQPAFEPDTKACLINQAPQSYPFTCDATHPKTARLCPCFDEKRELKEKQRLKSTQSDELDGFAWLDQRMFGAASPPTN